ncbi:MAG: hypothetical protein WCT03_10300 [Candidatus Obscuribacterales bacterium]|jgi:hypothetical protein
MDSCVFRGARWEKLGLLFQAEKQRPWLHLYAANPIGEVISNEVVRVYFSPRDASNRSCVATVDFTLADKFLQSELSSQPILVHGDRGYFDDSGCSLGCIVEVGDGRRFLYYVGWNLGKTAPWRNAIGLCISDKPDQPFVKYSNAPILHLDTIDPINLSYPWVLKEGDVWRMWYGSHTKWGPAGQEFEHVIKYAESKDGINWKRSGREVLSLEKPSEYALSRPFVKKEGGIYRMWYSRRGVNYRIGYAESVDGISWTRYDSDVGLDVSGEGWDSEMIEYATLFEMSGQSYMLYNGNHYGQQGFGIARLNLQG